ETCKWGRLEQSLRAVELLRTGCANLIEAAGALVAHQASRRHAARPFLVDRSLQRASGPYMHHLAQHVDVGSLLGELGQCHSGGGHRGNLLGHSWWIAPQPYP